MFKYVPNFIPENIFVIGCGGTGSRLVPQLAQFIASISRSKHPLGWLADPTIYLVDDDTVEEKNLLRQNFVAPDVGKHKAAVLAKRYNAAYGVNIVPMLRRIDGEGNVLDATFPRGSATIPPSIVILCVDTAQARRKILKEMSRNVCSLSEGLPKVFVVDAGNEDSFGQVRFFNMTKGASLLNEASSRKVLITKSHKGVLQEMVKFKGMEPAIVTIPAIPIDIEYYQELEDSTVALSCADLDQTLAINSLMAAEIMGIVQNFYYVKDFVYDQVSTSLEGGRSTSYLTLRRLASRGLGSMRIEENVPDDFSAWIRTLEAAYMKLPMWSYFDTCKSAQAMVEEAQAKAEATLAPKEAPIESLPESNMALRELGAVESIQVGVEAAPQVKEVADAVPVKRRSRAKKPAARTIPPLTTASEYASVVVDFDAPDLADELQAVPLVGTAVQPTVQTQGTGDVPVLQRTTTSANDDGIGLL